MIQLVTHTPGLMVGLAPFLPLALPRPPLPDSPAPLGLLRPGKPEPRPCGCKTQQQKQKKITMLNLSGARRHTVWDGWTHKDKHQPCLKYANGQT